MIKQILIVEDVSLDSGQKVTVSWTEILRIPWQLKLTSEAKGNQNEKSKTKVNYFSGNIHKNIINERHRKRCEHL